MTFIPKDKNQENFKRIFKEIVRLDKKTGYIHTKILVLYFVVLLNILLTLLAF